MDELEQLVRHPNWCYRWHLKWIPQKREWWVQAKWGGNSIEVVSVGNTAIEAAKKALSRIQPPPDHSARSPATLSHGSAKTGARGLFTEA